VTRLGESGLRILFISNGYPPDRWAGTENHTAALATAFNRRGAKVRVLCAGEWSRGDAHFNSYEDSVWNGVEVRRIHLNWTKALKPFGYLYNNPVVAATLSGLLDELRPDLVHVMSCETLSASVLRVTKDAGVPLVLSLTDFWFLCPQINLLRSDGENCDGNTTAAECIKCLGRSAKIYRWPRLLLPEPVVMKVLTFVSRYPVLTRMRGLRGIVGNMELRKSFLREALQLPDVRLTASPFVRAVHQANGVDAEILVRAYGHDLSWMASGVSKAPSFKIRLGYVGQIQPSKGVHLILGALRNLPTDVRSRFSALIYGDPDKMPEYGARLRLLAEGLEDVRFMGTYRFSESAKVYSSFDVLVVPSLWYDFPLVVHEALATRTPVVATNLGGMAEVVEQERNGLLFEKGDVEGLSRLLLRLAREPELIERLRRGIEPVKTIAEEVDELTDLYESLLGEVPV
jgi:glycosyltransferase involved in cell wall biosynthesis